MYLLLPVCCYFRYFTSKEQQQQVSSLNIIMVPTKRPNLFDVILIIKRMCVFYIYHYISGVCTESYPYAFDSGNRCCKNAFEKPKGYDGCRGYRISLDSTCCNGDEITHCRDVPCSSFGKINTYSQTK